MRNWTALELSVQVGWWLSDYLKRPPQATSGPSGGMNQINATRQGVQVNILGSNSAAVGLPMFKPSNQSQQGRQPTQVSPSEGFD